MGMGFQFEQHRPGLWNLSWDLKKTISWEMGLWNQRKEYQGLKGVSNIEFAERLLHQYVRIGSESEPLGSTSTPRQGEQCKKSEYL